MACRGQWSWVNRSRTACGDAVADLAAAPTLGPGGMTLHTVVSDHCDNPLITTMRRA